MAILKAKLSSGGCISGQLAQRGPQGYSAYDIAVQHGYTGTEEDWVNKWLRGTIVSVTTDSENNLVMTDINGNVFSVPVPSLSEAADSAAQAKQSATDAQTAQTAASSASTSATSASASASNASKSEVAAKTAQTAAEKARDDANSAVAKLTGVMKYAGQANNYSDLSDMTKNRGDVWNIVNADSEHGIKAGDNVVWNGSDWDNLSGIVDLSAYAEKADYQKAITSATANGDTITFNHKDGTTSTATVNNVASSTSATNDAKGQKIDTTYEKIADASNVHTSLQNSINTKQDKLTFDTTPTANSSNPVTSGGIKTALDTVSKKADIQADWNSTDSSSIAFIKNIPNSIKSINNSSKFRIKSFHKVDNRGYPTYRIIEELVNYHPTNRPSNYGVYGFSVIALCDIRLGNGSFQEPAFMYASLGYEYNMLKSTSGDDFPVVLHNIESDKYYVAIRTSGSYKDVILMGEFANPNIELGEEILAQDYKGTPPSGWELTYKPKDMLRMEQLQAGNSNKLGGYPLNTKAIGGQYNTVPLVNVDGVMEIGKYIDWHATSGGTEDYSSRWTAETNRTVSVGTINGTLNGNADSATKATNDGNGANIASTYVKKAGDTTTGKITFASTDLNALPEVKNTSDDNMSGVRFSSKTRFLGAIGKRLSNGEDLLNLRSDNNTTDVVLDSRNYNNYTPTKTGDGASGTWEISITGNADSATTATKANQDASGNVITDTYATKDYVTRAIKEALAAAIITDDGKITYKG